MKLAKQNGAPPLKIQARGDGSVRLSGPALEEAVTPPLRREFLDRCFAVPTLQTVPFIATGRTVELHFKRSPIPVSESLEGLSAAMRMRNPEELDLPHDEIVFSTCFGRPVEVHRAGDQLTFWRISSHGPRPFCLLASVDPHRARAPAPAG